MSMENFHRRFDAFWFAEESEANVTMARVLLCATALWVILSRFDLPSVLGYPSEMWAYVTLAQRIRFAYLLPLGVERALYVLLHVTLLCALFGVLPRLTCTLSGLLLVHFAPIETILWTPNPYLRGLTIPALGLLVLGFAGRRETRRWPLLLTQLFFAQIYFFAGYAKIFTSGFAWIDASNVRRYLLMLSQFLGFDIHSAAYMIAPHPWICAAIAWSGITFDFAFPVVLFWPATRRVVLPLAIFFHVANIVFFHIVFQEGVLLLLFIDWQPLAERIRAWQTAATAKAAS
jgi:HTTM domain